MPGYLKGCCSDSLVPKEQLCSPSSILACHFVCCIVGKHKEKNAGTDKIVFRPVPVLRNGARVLPLEGVPVPGA